MSDRFVRDCRRSRLTGPTAAPRKPAGASARVPRYRHNAPTAFPVNLTGHHRLWPKRGMEPPPRYTAAELRIIAYLAKIKGRLLTQGEINFNLAAAKSILGPDLTG
jgi:hypothetical protein